MRILVNAFPTNCQGGGALVKLDKLADQFRAAGHVVDRFDPWTTDIGRYDIYHHFSFFRWDVPMVSYVRTFGPKVVIETMYWWSWRYALLRPGAGRDKLRSVAHTLVKSACPWAAPQRRVAAAADLLIANSHAEARLLTRHFAIPARKIAVVPNGVDPCFAEGDPDLFEDAFGVRDFVLCVGMFEARKNQLALIRALEGTDIPLVLIGNVPPPHASYYRRCREEAGPNVHFLGHVPHDDPLLASAYAAAGTVVMPSWHETTGKVALEAAAAGGKLVVTTFSPIREYLGDEAIYVRPWDVAGIRDAVRRSLSLPRRSGLRERVLRRYVWPAIAEIRLGLYRRLLGDHQPSVAAPDDRLVGQLRRPG